MTSAEDAREEEAGAAPRPAAGPLSVSRRDKRRHRRRKSRYHRPLFSMAHFMVLIPLALTGVFVAALAQGLMLGDAGTPASAALARLQYAIWAYIFGMPAIFALHFAAFWRRTADFGRYLLIATMALWLLFVVVVVVTANSLI